MTELRDNTNQLFRVPRTQEEQPALDDGRQHETNLDSCGDDVSSCIWLAIGDDAELGGNQTLLWYHVIYFYEPTIPKDQSDVDNASPHVQQGRA
jgi:hypothetical protein